MSDQFDALTTSDEMDLEGEGLQPQTLNFVISNAEITDKETGRLVSVTFENGEALGFPVNATFWLKHTNEQAERIGRSNLKRLGKAAGLGSAFALDNLIGMVVSAYVNEDDSGFARVSRFGAPIVEESDVEEADL